MRSSIASPILASPGDPRGASQLPIEREERTVEREPTAVRTSMYAGILLTGILRRIVFWTPAVRERVV